MTDDLLSVHDVAELAGVADATIHTYIYRGVMPEPDMRFGQSPVWHRETIERWLESRRGRVNDPREG